MDRLYHSEFLLMDAGRRAQGEFLGGLGLGPVERRYEVVASEPGWRLRDYGGGMRAPLLVIASPIKRPYIWDLGPGVSAIGYCLAQGFHVELLEWTPPHLGDDPMGLDDYLDAITQAVDRVKAAGAAPILLGHSLGGTLAAVYAAFATTGPAGVVLLSAPVSFGAGACRFRDAVVRLVGARPGQTDLVPGSFLGHVSAIAAPGAFVWSRLLDVAASLADARALDTLLRIERWMLDEVPVPGKFMIQVLDWLYCEDRFGRNALPAKGRILGPQNIAAPTLAVVAAGDDVAPYGAVGAFLNAAPARSQIIEYPGESGVALQHLALLVGRCARKDVWPQIAAWIDGAAQGA